MNAKAKNTTRVTWGRATTDGEFYESECRSKCGRWLIGATEAESGVRIYNLAEWCEETQDHEERQGFATQAEAKAEAQRIVDGEE